MVNKGNGRNTIKLIFMIIVTIVIIVGIIFLLKYFWKDNSRTDLLTIQGKCKNIYDKSIIDENEELLGENITEYTENEAVNAIISQSGKWYKLSQEDLEKIGLGSLKAKDGYLVNYEENDVIYAKGIKKDDKIYYRLSDLIEE